jgi:hypothetical protein
MEVRNECTANLFLNNINPFFHKIWNIPDGIATLISGLFVIFGAYIAWRGVQKQIKSSENIEKIRNENEISAIENGFTVDLLVYSSSIMQALSVWNDRALKLPNGSPDSIIPLLIDPLFYRENWNG